MTKPYRVQHQFWLDITREDEDDLDRAIFELKQKREWASTLRNALRLFLELKAGRADMLLEMFPFVGELLKANNEDLKREIQRVQDMILHNSQPVRVNAPVVDSAPLPSIFAKVDIKASAKDARNTFAAGAGNLFGDDDEDLWN